MAFSQRRYCTSQQSRLIRPSSSQRSKTPQQPLPIVNHNGNSLPQQSQCIDRHQNKTPVIAAASHQSGRSPPSALPRLRQQFRPDLSSIRRQQTPQLKASDPQRADTPTKPSLATTVRTAVSSKIHQWHLRVQLFYMCEIPVTQN